VTRAGATALAFLPALALASALACEREERRFDDAAAHARRIEPPARTSLHPGGVTPGEAPGTPDTARGDNALDSAWAIGEGQRLFVWFNCAGCHANGGGGMGPPLMDSEWLYGSEPPEIFDSIVAGRPNGMPAFGGRIPEQQVWQLVAYVRSLSGNVPLDVRPGRSDSLSAKVPSSIDGRHPPRAAPAKEVP
jgi:cytochrome c oxidase cbb3-type subunit 3